MSAIDHKLVRLSRTQVLIAVGLAVALFALYLVFDLRAAGPKQNLGSTMATSIPGLVHMFGLWYVVSSLALDAVLAGASALLMMRSFELLRARRAAGKAGACTAAGSVLVGFGVFSCPGCTVPLLGTLGVTFAASSLPLNGLEFKLADVALVLAVLWWSRRSVKSWRALASGGQLPAGAAP